MRIAFITSSLEPGRDGVGDYTRRLAGECIRQGHPSVILSLNDAQVALPLGAEQDSEGTAVSVLRLPAIWSWRARSLKAVTWVNAFNPDWTSLQFVPFGFHSRGLCFGLGKRLAMLNPQTRWHVMFHELWLGLERGSPVRYRIWGALQRIAVKNLIRELHPAVLHTQTESYRKVLAREGLHARRLPLFSNVPNVRGDGWAQIIEPLLAKEMGKTQLRETVYLAGVFGTVHPEWDAEQTVEILLPLTKRFRKQLVLVFLGKSNLSPEQLGGLKSKLRSRATVIATGERSSLQISSILQALDLGLAATPRQLIHKSGAAAAMLDHGLRILVARDDWHLRHDDNDQEERASWLLPPKQMAVLDALPSRQNWASAETNIKNVTARMLGDLSAGTLTEGYSRRITTSHGYSFLANPIPKGRH